MRHLFAAVFLALPLAGLPMFTARAAELVMVEQPGCAYCRAWDQDVSEEYPKTAEGRAAPLVRVQLATVNDGPYTLARPVNFTPTFLLVEDGAELARIEGYPGEDFFWGLLAMMLKAQGIAMDLPASEPLDG